MRVKCHFSTIQASDHELTRGLANHDLIGCSSRRVEMPKLKQPRGKPIEPQHRRGSCATGTFPVITRSGMERFVPFDDLV